MKVEVLKDKMTRGVIDRVIKIDKTFYRDFDYSDTSWYFKRYNKNKKLLIYKL